MNKSADANELEMLISERFISVNKYKHESFSKYIKDRRKEVLSDSGKEGLTTRELAEKIGINYEQFRKILNKQKQTKKRDCIIAICAQLKLDTDETNDALILYNHFPCLDKFNKRDDAIINILEEQSKRKRPFTINEINERLNQEGFDELDIIDHRSSGSKKAITKSPFVVKKKRVRNFAKELFLGDPNQSLATEYSISRYHCIAEMLLDDTRNNKSYVLSSDTTNNYVLKERKGAKPKCFDKLEESGEFLDYFRELKVLANREKKNLLSTLNDTKNYQIRISASICDDSLYVYAETYNYSVPEMNEYYLFEYKNGKPLFSVYHTSEFMRCYLSDEEYYLAYGHRQQELIVQYKSLDELTCNDTRDINTSFLLQSRKGYFNRLQQEADNLIADLKNKKRYVRCLSSWFDCKEWVCNHFGVEKEFECELVDQYGDILVARKESADFIFEDCGIVNISLPELYEAFEYGFHNINEICRVKKKLGNISNIIS